MNHFFMEEYKKFLGFENNTNETTYVCKTQKRELPINKKYFHPVIFTSMGGSFICSVTDSLYGICKNRFDGKIKSIKEIFDSVDLKDKQLRSFRRYLIKENKYSENKNVETLSLSLIEKFNIDCRIKEKIINNHRVYIRENNFFCIREKNKIISKGFISDIFGKLANIVVYTNPEHRNRTYGSQVVSKCINWCLQRDLIPMYLVEENNSASISLIENHSYSLIGNEKIISFKASDHMEVYLSS